MVLQAFFLTKPHIRPLKSRPCHSSQASAVFARCLQAARTRRPVWRPCQQRRSRYAVAKRASGTDLHPSFELIPGARDEMSHVNVRSVKTTTLAPLFAPGPQQFEPTPQTCCGVNSSHSSTTYWGLRSRGLLPPAREQGSARSSETRPHFILATID